MNNQFMRRSHVLCPTMPSGTTRNNRRAATATEASNSNPSGVRETNRVAMHLLRLTVIFTLLLIGGQGVQANPTLKYIDSTPASGEIITKLDDIRLNFDFTDVIAAYGENDNWGICYSGYIGDEYTPESSVRVYKGDADSGELLIQAYTDVLKPNSEAFEVGYDFRISLPEIEIENSQLYTLVITEKFSAGIKGEKKRKSDTVLDLTESPIILEFYGSGDIVNKMDILSCDIEENVEYENLSNVRFSFDREITINENVNVELMEDSRTVAVSNSLQIDGSDPKTILVTFPTTELYRGHSYELVLAAGTVAAKDNPDVINKKVSIPIKGISYRYFGTKRVAPTNGSTSVLDEIIVIFNFPEVDGNSYGFVNVNSGKKKWYGYLYEGAIADGEPLLQLAGEVGDDSQSLLFHPNFDFKPETEYSFAIPEGEVLAYKLGVNGVVYLPEYLSERVELHYTTPSVEDLPAWSPSVINLRDNDEIEYLDYLILDCPEYRYGRNIYETTFNRYNTHDCALYRVTDNGDELVKTFFMWKRDLDANSQIGNGQYKGSYFVATVNEPLYAGSEYKVVWKANSVIIDSPFIGRYVGNPEIAVTLKGAARTAFDITCNYGEAFSIANIINRGEGTTLRFTPSEEWAVDTVTVNGEEAELTDGVLVLSDVTEDMNVSVSYKFTGGISFNYSTGVDGVEDDCPYFVAIGESYVALSGLEIGSTIEVYNTVGMLVGTSVATDSEVKIETVPGLAVVVIRKTDATPVAITVRIP